MPVILVATLDTKGRELGYVRDLIRQAGLATLVIDAGSLGPPVIKPDITREGVFGRAGITRGAIEREPDRGTAVAKAAEGVAAIVRDIYDQNQLDALFALGGSAGTVIGTAAMRALPFGVPKVMVSTLASGQTRPYVGGSDIVMINPVADLAGLNRLTRAALENAAGAVVGMVKARQAAASKNRAEKPADRPVIAATMFGVTTPCVDVARQVLEVAGYEVQVFHATGAGGQAMEGLVRDGEVSAVLDITTTELADELVGGVLSAGPDRLEAAGRRGIPQVVSVGALDMVNFGPIASVPERFNGRTFHVHNPSVTLMRTSPQENAALGARMAEVLSRSRGPVVLMLPKGGISALDAPGQPFRDPEADLALFGALADNLDGRANVRLVVREEHINDPVFAEAAAGALIELLRNPDSIKSDD
jgi:uncharacterized protein (UPF0261 family)